MSLQMSAMIEFLGVLGAGRSEHFAVRIIIDRQAVDALVPRVFRP